MKPLVEHFMESLQINEANYKPAKSLKEWEDFLKEISKGGAGNYSQIGMLDTSAFENVARENWSIPDAAEDWLSYSDLPEKYQDIVEDMLRFVAAYYYASGPVGYRDNGEDLDLEIKPRVMNDSTAWGVEEEDYYRYFEPEKKLTGQNKKYGELLAQYGDCTMDYSNY